MKKIHVKLDAEEKIDIIVNGIKKGNTYKYLEGDVKVVLKVNKTKAHLTREAKDYTIDLVFDKDSDTISNYKVFDNPKVFELPTRTKKIEYNDSKVEIDYEINEEKFKYKVEVID